jgi:hypothetical protein
MNVLTVFFPGVWIHEGAHALACLIGRVKVHRIHVRSSSGVVVHDPTNARNAWMIALAPLIAGTIIAFTAWQAAQNAWETQPIIAFVLGWISISSGFHSIPSTTDAFNIPRAILSRFKETISGNHDFLVKIAKLAGYIITLPISILTAGVIFLANTTILFRLAWVGAILLVA